MVKSITTRSKTASTNSTVAPSPHGTVVETSNSHVTDAAQLGPFLEQVLPHPPLPPQPLNVAPIRSSEEALGCHQLGSTQLSLAFPNSQAYVNCNVDELTRRVEDQSNLVDWLLR